ncbi:DUF221-domain-containing protein [Lindgomyces ingoldianus]|uniref:DUF221-domain-containing protein n=1 Tax=Lindgomyces ingoldianus TaxID=673940 RepID=A0ACB6R561_9PLEO|nr:DUF221-domain-containing protein [Lindgomyces ingoldianus]KAF2473450.1 DUF221-domain-containing protein [Lindgomyces ingoldianus]
MAATPAGAMLPRATEENLEDKFLKLISDPFGAQLAQDSIIAAVTTSFVIFGAIFLAFVLLQPYNQTVYAPRLKHADEKHKPPSLPKKPLGWWNAVFRTNEDFYVEKIGMDAAIFLRFAKMCRNIFCVLSVVGCAILIPVNITQSTKFSKDGGFKKSAIIISMTPKDLFGHIWWAFVAVAWVFDVIICGFLWWNYRAVHRLRRRYLDTPEYQTSLHSRTLMITDIPRSLRSDQGLVDITDKLRTTPEVPRASIGRNVKDIPDLIEEHEEAVIELEKVLAKYLKNPNQLPADRPLCKPSKKDPEYTNKNEKVDAITYLTARIERLESQIKGVRETVDKRDAMPYGFASYETLESAHSVAFAAKNKHPKGTSVQLAPRPNDLIWKNLPIDAKARRWRRFINNLWITLLTVLYFIPNALIAVFLAQLNNLAFIWPQFGDQMQKNPKFWAIVQGIAAPALTSLFYYFLPIIFRRLSVQAGDFTKTARERHVIHQLYAFFVFNNLFVFSLFAAAFAFVSAMIKATRDQGKSFKDAVDDYHPFVQIMISLCTVSPFWVTWLLQRNLGAAIDLSQVVNLAWGSFSRKFLNPTPRELIKRTAPPPFDYASYYNYFLFYSTVALCFAALQPICLVVTAVYFVLDAWMKKYLLLYVFCTKTESGGLYWRVLFNRFLVGALMSNCLIALMVGARGDQPIAMLCAMAPLPILLLGFKYYCKITFDNSMRYYVKGESIKGSEAPAPIDKESRRRDRVAVRFGHPALYQKLTVPMVHEKSKHLLAEVYRGRLDGDLGATAGYSDVYSMKRMSKETPGKTAAAPAPFEFVSESNMDFENFKDRPEFSAEHGGDGSVYGAHISRPGTPASTVGGGSERGRSSSRDSERTVGDDGTGVGVTYPAGYHSTPSGLREYSPSPDHRVGFGRVESNTSGARDETNLLYGAAPMGAQTPNLGQAQGESPYTLDDSGRQDYFKGVR